jgi:hypothetical protein
LLPPDASQADSFKQVIAEFPEAVAGVKDKTLKRAISMGTNGAKEVMGAHLQFPFRLFAQRRR